MMVACERHSKLVQEHLAVQSSSFCGALQLLEEVAVWPVILVRENQLTVSVERRAAIAFAKESGIGITRSS